VEVRRLTGEMAPNGAAWVLIEKEGEGFAICGRAHRSAIDASFVSHGLNTPEVAIRASVAWADLLDIPLLFVRE
jgi:hypothetical protein